MGGEREDGPEIWRSHLQKISGEDVRCGVHMITDSVAS
jgi:hypothetical protein